jgi:transcriptional regulator with XRE-family HTH domain
MAVRLKDIAQDLGVSTVTVSKVLRGNADIGERTRARVLQRMRELNYQPNMQSSLPCRSCWDACLDPTRFFVTTTSQPLEQ